MKIHKLNARGFSHELIIVAAVVVVGVAGSAALVLSHADSCTPVSGAASGSADSAPTSNCTPDSGPTSQPTSTVAAASCTIAMADSKPVGSSVSPVLTVKNNSSSALTNLKSSRLKFVMPDGTENTLPHVTLASLNPGSVHVFKLGSQSLGATPGTAKLVAKFLADQNVSTSCTAQVTVTPQS